MRAAPLSLLALALLAMPLAARPAAAQDLEAGQRAFNKCRACHQIGEGARNLVGPELNGLIGRHSGAVAGYSYSSANTKIPGTKMIFAGIKSDKEIADLTAFLKQFDKDGRKL